MKRRRLANSLLLKSTIDMPTGPLHVGAQHVVAIKAKLALVAGIGNKLDADWRSQLVFNGAMAQRRNATYPCRPP